MSDGSRGRAAARARGSQARALVLHAAATRVAESIALAQRRDLEKPALPTFAHALAADLCEEVGKDLDEAARVIALDGVACALHLGPASIV